jgi:transposase
MAIMKLALRLKLQEYRAELLDRVRQVRCARCGAKPKEPCVNPRGPQIGKSGQWCHGWRHNEAKRVGLVKGRWFDEKKWGVHL